MGGWWAVIVREEGTESDAAFTLCKDLALL